MTLTEAQTLAAKITPRRLARALSVTSIAFCKARDQHGRLRRYAVVASSSTPGAVHYVTGEGCDCKGWQARGWCRHSDAVNIALTVRVSFKRNGEVFGVHITYQSRHISDEERAVYHRALLAALSRCSPLPLSAGLGQAIAGRPLTFHIEDTRQQRKA